MVISKSSQKKPFFSIIIPTLNEEEYLPKLLNCLQKQSFDNFEVLVVDGYSNDETPKITKNYQKKIINLTLLDSKKRNVSYQRNLGAKKAKGEYLIFIDADVCFTKDALEKTYQYILNNNPFIFFTKFSFDKNSLDFRIIAYLTNAFFYLNNYLKKNLAMGQFLVMKKEVFNKLGGYNESLALSEDHNLIKQARKARYNPLFTPKISVIVSSRRIKKEGWLVFLSKYFYFIITEKIKGPIYHKPPLDYPMGGHHYG